MKVYPIICLFILMIGGVPLFANEGGNATVDSAAMEIRRIQAHLIIRDYDRACNEAQAALKNHPGALPLYPLAIEAWGRQGNEQQMWMVWKQFIDTFSLQHDNGALLDILAWGVLQKGATAPSAIIRTAALLGAASGNDARGVQLILHALRDTNIVVRGVAVQFVPQMRDSCLVNQLMTMLEEEKEWRVRLEVMRALGQLQYTPAKAMLLSILSNEQSSVEERALAMEALVNMTESASREEVKALVTSSRGGLRALGCQVVMHLDLGRDVDLVTELLHDPLADVRAIALLTLGVLKNKQSEFVRVAECLADSNPLVGITAAWLMALYDDPRGFKAFRTWFQNPSQEIQVRAAAALSATGKHGLPLMIEIFRESKEEYVKINLAWGLIGQRELSEEVADFLQKQLKKHPERWCMENEAIFQRVVPSQWRTHTSLLVDLETENQLTRLEVLNQLALIDSEKALPAIKYFLSTSRWGITGVASLLLLREGDETALDGVRCLLNDPQPQVKIQAALALAQWGRDPAALQVLQEAYPASERRIKEVIIEAIGRIGDRSAIPFLVERMQEPHQTLRLLAAAAVIETLNS